MTDTYQIVTDRIISELEKGVIPWRKPWCSVQEGAFNRVSGRSYSLLNQLLLQHDGEYASYRQWKALGGHVKAGSKAETVVFWKFEDEAPVQKSTGDTDGEETTEERPRAHPILKYYPVFHISQVEDVKPADRELHLADACPNATAEMYFRSYVQREHISVEEGLSNNAFYSPSTDSIHLPSIRQFHQIEEYYSTAFHECIHSTGIKSRLAREGLQHIQFGSMSYGKEELIAEIGSSFIMNSIGLHTHESDENNAAYIGSWLAAIKGNKKLVVMAASQAEKAANYILNGTAEKR